MTDAETLKKILDRLDLTPNESEVYLTLLLRGPLNASEISDISGITRANIYPIVKRLVQKKFVDEQPLSRASKYKALHPQKAIEELQQEIRTRHEQKIQDLQDISSQISKLDLNPSESTDLSPSDSVWLINSEARIKASILELLEKSEHTIIACLPTLDEPDYMATRQEILDLLARIMKEKKKKKKTKEKKKKMDLILHWELEEGGPDETIARTLNKYEATIYHWGVGELPFSAFLIDHSEGLIILQSAQIPTPKFELALWIRHPTYIRPFEVLITEKFKDAGALVKWDK